MSLERIPWKLQVVAYLALLSGVSGVVKFMVAISHGSMYLPFDVVGIPVCLGLLHYRPGWRTVALICLWSALICLPVIFGIGIFAGRTYFEFLGMRVADMPRALFLGMGIAVYALVVWQYRVLTDPEIRRLFPAKT